MHTRHQFQVFAWGPFIPCVHPVNTSLTNVRVNKFGVEDSSVLGIDANTVWWISFGVKYCSGLGMGV